MSRQKSRKPALGKSASFSSQVPRQLLQCFREAVAPRKWTVKWHFFGIYSPTLSMNQKNSANFKPSKTKPFMEETAFVSQWDKYMELGSMFCVALGVLILLYHEFRVM